MWSVGPSVRVQVASRCHFAIGPVSVAVALAVPAAIQHHKSKLVHSLRMSLSVGLPWSEQQGKRRSSGVLDVASTYEGSVSASNPSSREISKGKQRRPHSRKFAPTLFAHYQFSRPDVAAGCVETYRGGLYAVLRVP